MIDLLGNKCDQWFGGGIDATPCIKDDRERKFFHKLTV